MRQPKQAKGTGESQMRAGAKGTADVNEAVKPPGSQYPKVHDGHVSADSGHSRARAKLDAICERIRQRTHVNHACALEGVPRSSLYALLDADEDARLAFDAARAVAAESRRNEIEKLALGIPNEGMSAPNANVLLHLLERSHPDEYAPPKQRTEVTGAEGKPQEHAITLTIEQARAGAADGAIPGESE